MIHHHEAVQRQAMAVDELPPYHDPPVPLALVVLVAVLAGAALGAVAALLVAWVG